jgi:3-methyl-2-oxobutanoate hydroxymethyltransferase
MGGDATSTSPTSPRQKLLAPAIRAAKGGAPLVMVTAYDAPTARLAQEAGVDLILVGDSVGTALLGFDSTVPVTIEMILHHCRAVRRGAPKTHIIGDLPFMTYQASDEQAVVNAGRLLQEGGADAVKLEGGQAMASRIAAITAAGIPVMAHIGLTPQSAGNLGGLKVQGNDVATAKRLLADADAAAQAGAYALVIEVVPAALAQRITQRVPIPTIGIGAGPACDGQVLVSTDLLGFGGEYRPRFVERYADLAGTIRDAFIAYARDVREGSYPRKEHTYGIRPEVLRELDT